MFLTHLCVCIILHTYPPWNEQFAPENRPFILPPKRVVYRLQPWKMKKNARGKLAPLVVLVRVYTIYLVLVKLKPFPQTFGVKIPKNLWETTGHGNETFSINKTTLEDRNLTLWRPFGAGLPRPSKFHPQHSESSQNHHSKQSVWIQLSKKSSFLKKIAQHSERSPTLILINESIKKTSIRSIYFQPPNKTSVRETTSHPVVFRSVRSSQSLFQATQGTELGQQVRELGAAENFRGQGVVLRDVLPNRWRVGGWVVVRWDGTTGWMATGNLEMKSPCWGMLRERSLVIPLFSKIMHMVLYMQTVVGLGISSIHTGKAKDSRIILIILHHIHLLGVVIICYNHTVGW